MDSLGRWALAFLVNALFFLFWMGRREERAEAKAKADAEARARQEHEKASSVAEPLPANRFRRKVERVDIWEADFAVMRLSLTRDGGILLSNEPIVFELCDDGDGRLSMRYDADGLPIAVENIEARLAGRQQDGYQDDHDRVELARLKSNDPLRLPPSIAAELQEAYGRYLAGNKSA